MAVNVTQKNSLKNSNVYLKNYIIFRNYMGVKSVKDMEAINIQTKKLIDKLIKLNQPVRILLDLNNKFNISFEIYEEAIKILNYTEIYKIAVVENRNRFINALAKNSQDTYQKFLQYKIFKNKIDAIIWLSETNE